MTENTEHQGDAPAEKETATTPFKSKADLKAEADAILKAAGKSGPSDEELAEIEAAEEEFAEEQEEGHEAYESPLEALAAENSRLEAENAELNDRALRTAAEMQNLRQRTQREIGDAKSYAIANFARDLLSVSDNLNRAIAAVPEEDKEQSGLKNLIEGVEMTERELLNTLEKHGVKKLTPDNEKFDPNFHQAMFEVQDPSVPNNTVTQVVQDGYVIGDRVLRPAMVGVAKGGPKSVTKDEAES